MLFPILLGGIFGDSLILSNFWTCPRQSTEDVCDAGGSLRCGDGHARGVHMFCDFWMNKTKKTWVKLQGKTSGTILVAVFKCFFFSSLLVPGMMIQLAINSHILGD